MADGPFAITAIAGQGGRCRQIFLGVNEMAIPAMRALFLTAAVTATIAGCTSQSGTTGQSGNPLMAARDKLVADIGQCSQRYGYGPRSATGIAENVLGAARAAMAAMRL